MSIQVSLRAKGDLLRAEAWHEERAPGLGRDFLGAFDLAMDVIELSPEGFPAVFGDVRRIVLRRFPFVVFYILDHGTAIILAVVHERRSPDRWPLR